jgi:hypothetical protein
MEPSSPWELLDHSAICAVPVDAKLEELSRALTLVSWTPEPERKLCPIISKLDKASCASEGAAGGRVSNTTSPAWVWVEVNPPDSSAKITSDTRAHELKNFFMRESPLVGSTMSWKANKKPRRRVWISGTRTLALVATDLAAGLI